MNGAHARSFVATLLGLLFLGCSASRPAPEIEPVHASASPFAPDWRGEPLGWSKLDRIETWLVGPGPARFPAEVPAAELELAEGRLELACRDAAKLERKVLELRLASAEAGFRHVLADQRVPAHLRARAEAGLQATRGLRSGTPAAATDPVLAQVVPRSKWGAAPPVPANLTRNGQPWRRITVHHSARPTSEIGGSSLASSADTIRKIQLVHMRDRAFGDIGYHFLIDPAGRIFQGRTLEWQGAHAEGSNNVANIGVCLLGDFDHERPTSKALRALEGLVGSLSKQHSIAASAIKGHEQFKPTECPGTYLMAWVRSYASRAVPASSSVQRTAAVTGRTKVPTRMR
jgi:hypothetical protein